MADQTPDYRAAPVTQRDGSKLQNSNCRMASIAVGLDFDTLGKKKSTGAKMRSYQNDQEGGTDATDAKLAWSRGYSENLDIQDGNSWAQAKADLLKFRTVHIDVWHKTTGGPCLSGSGAYGHTMVIAPDLNSHGWLVCDPWCKPAKWSRVSESKLRAGAEEWGRRVYGAATSGPGHIPTIADLQRAAKRLMLLYHAGGDEDPSEDPGDTGGGQRIMYTATTGHPPSSGGGSGGSMGIQTISGGIKTTTLVALPKDQSLYADSELKDYVTKMSKAADVPYIGLPMPGDPGKGKSRAVLIGTGAPYSDGVVRPTILYVDDKFATKTGPPICPDVPPPAPGDCADEVAAAINKRDDEWREWLLAGAPGQRDGPT